MSGNSAHAGSDTTMTQIPGTPTPFAGSPRADYTASLCIEQRQWVALPGGRTLSPEILSLSPQHTCSNCHKSRPRSHTSDRNSGDPGPPLPTVTPRLKVTGGGGANFSQRHERNHKSQLIYLLLRCQVWWSPRTQPPAEARR